MNSTSPSAKPGNSGPIVIGVAGGSGSGKTTVVRRIVDSLGDAQVTVIEHDRYYRVITGENTGGLQAVPIPEPLNLRYRHGSDGTAIWRGS